MAERVPELGIIEGFYGRPWSWSARAETVRALAPHGYRSYLYAPKGDASLRRRWREAPPDGLSEDLVALRRACAEAGVRFGVGVSPWEIFRDWGAESREALGRKLAWLDGVGVEDVALLFDDMRGDQPDLAERQAEIVTWAAGRTSAERVFLCPTYYSDDPVLDRVFGARPEGYLRTLGEALDPAVEIFWTGPEVVSRELSPGHVERVAEELGRPPFLWDNYPVNDGQRMSQYLHLRASTGRPATLAGVVSGHGVNPALQPVLSRIPMRTLAERYAEGEAYDYGRAFRRAAREVVGEALAERLAEDLLILQDVGLDRLGEHEERLRGRWEGVDHPAAREIVGWLDGEYRITDETVRTQ